MTSFFFKTAKTSSESFIILFGSWTIASNLAVIFQWPFRSLFLVFPVLTLIGFCVLMRTDFFKGWRVLEENQKKEEAQAKNSTSCRLTEIAFILLVVVVLFIALFANKHNFDDAHYLRTSVDMVDHPKKAVLLKDALGLFEGAPLLLPVYKAQSVESFCAAISTLTGVPVIYVFHFFLPTLGLFLSVMAYLLLFRILIPRKALQATILSFVLIYAVSLRAMGNCIFIRMHQGKGFLLGVILPLIIVYGLQAAGNQKNRNWVILALVQVCAIGMNATALWLAPIVANLSVITGTLAKKPSLLIRNTAFGVLSSLYMLLFGLYLLTSFQMPPFYVTQETDAIKLIAGSIHRVLGHGIAMYMSLFIFFFTWIFAPNRLTRILSLVFPAFLLLVFYNPLLTKFMAKYVVSEQTYWRTIWLIPLQVYMGIIGISVFVKSKNGRLILPKAIFVIVMFFMFLTASPSKSRLFAKNSRVDIKLPSLKVTREYYVAKQINSLLTETDLLISPNTISMWISTMHRHPETLVYRKKFTVGVLYHYLSILEKNKNNDIEKFIKWTSWYEPVDYAYPSTTPLAKRIRRLQEETGVSELQMLLDYEFKLQLKNYISGDSQVSNQKDYFFKGLRHYQVTAVCMPEKLKWKTDVIRVIEKKGFKLIERIDGFEFWKKSSNITRKL